MIKCYVGGGVFKNMYSFRNHRKYKHNQKKK